MSSDSRRYARSSVRASKLATLHPVQLLKIVIGQMVKVTLHVMLTGYLPKSVRMTAGCSWHAVWICLSVLDSAPWPNPNWHCCVISQDQLP